MSGERLRKMKRRVALKKRSSIWRYCGGSSRPFRSQAGTGKLVENANCLFRRTYIPVRQMRELLFAPPPLRTEGCQFGLGGFATCEEIIKLFAAFVKLRFAIGARNPLRISSDAVGFRGWQTKVWTLNDL